MSGTPTLAGNVKFLSDLYSAATDGLASPGYFITTGDQRVGIYHVNVAIATNGTDNSITFTTNCAFTGGSIVQSMIDIHEYNTYGRMSSAPAPVLVNSAGTVIAP